MTDQEAENATAAVRHLLIQRGIDAREWERQSKQWEGVAIAQRKELDELRNEKQILCDLLDPDATGQTLVEAVRAIIAERDEAIDEAGRQADTNLYWMRELSRARTALQAARTYVDRMTIQVGPVAHEGIAPARHVLALIDAALGEVNDANLI